MNCGTCKWFNADAYADTFKNPHRGQCEITEPATALPDSMFVMRWPVHPDENGAACTFHEARD